MKVAIITCYNQPDYVRAKTLRAAATLIKDIEVIEIKNSQTGVLRYLEVLWKVAKSRYRDKPDVYLLTFRGYEVLLPIRLISLGKPLIYDEFINPIEWVVLEKRQVEANQRSGKAYATMISLISRLIVYVVSSKVFTWSYRQLIRSVDLVLADTDSHAEASSKITKVERSRIEGMFVGTDEQTFTHQKAIHKKNDRFTVLYYGNMLPLHGLEYVIDAAKLLSTDSIQFVLIGGNAKVGRDVRTAISEGANIEYHEWVDFELLPEYMNRADLCIAGPFGGTFQSQYVITGKTYQYLAMGRPTLIGANEESHNFIDKKNVLITPQKDAHALAETLRWAMNNRNTLPAIGKAGRKLYDEKFAVPVLSSQLQRMLTRVTGPKKLGPSAE